MLHLLPYHRIIIIIILYKILKGNSMASTQHIYQKSSLPSNVKCTTNTIQRNENGNCHNIISHSYHYHRNANVTHSTSTVSMRSRETFFIANFFQFEPPNKRRLTTQKGILDLVRMGFVAFQPKKKRKKKNEMRMNSCCRIVLRNWAKQINKQKTEEKLRDENVLQ